eukprot:gb/GECH01009310.1/.p1 GENE.gb/GECH01009310.1/~~gb/GECH01009310.1/.p1  ORF type:complete len:303 (+),score=70.99 gb/GECH01009310.1/:1-909(+)
MEDYCEAIPSQDSIFQSQEPTTPTTPTTPKKCSSTCHRTPLAESPSFDDEVIKKLNFNEPGSPELGDDPAPKNRGRKRRRGSDRYIDDMDIDDDTAARLYYEEPAPKRRRTGGAFHSEESNSQSGGEFPPDSYLSQEANNPLNNPPAAPKKTPDARAADIAAGPSARSITFSQESLGSNAGDRLSQQSDTSDSTHVPTVTLEPQEDNSTYNTLMLGRTNPSCILGRTRECNITCAQVSRKQAEISVDLDGGVNLTTLSSRATAVHRHDRLIEVRQHEMIGIYDGDIIDLFHGRYSYRVIISQ